MPSETSPSPDAPSPDPIHNIIAFDGGPSALLQLRLLAKVEQSCPGFLEKTDLFAGTGDGAYIALFLASRLEADQPGGSTLEDCIHFTHSILRSWRASLPRLLMFATGLWPLGELSQLKEHLHSEFKDTRLDAITRRKVLIVGFDERTRHARLFGNFFEKLPKEGLHPCISESDKHKISHVALAGSVFPMLQPLQKIGDGQCMDGSFVANNPAMVALASALNYNSSTAGGTGHAHEPRPGPSLHALRLMSLGSRQQSLQAIWPSARGLFSLAAFALSLLPPAWRNESTRGWYDWLVSPPLSLIDTALQGSLEVVDYQCRQLFGDSWRKHYIRSAPLLAQTNIMLAVLDKRVTPIEEYLEARERECAVDIEQLVSFIRGSGWQDAAGQSSLRASAG